MAPGSGTTGQTQGGRNSSPWDMMQAAYKPYNEYGGHKLRPFARASAYPPTSTTNLRQEAGAQQRVAPVRRTPDGPPVKINANGDVVIDFVRR